MQAQATNAPAAGASDAPQSFLQNPKVQIGVIVGGALALIGVIWMVFFSGGGSAPAPAPVGSVDGGVSSPGATPGSPEAGSPVEPNAPALSGGVAAPPAAAGTAPAPGGTPPAAAAVPENAPTQSPGVPVRRNGFQPNTEVKRILRSIPPPPEAPEFVAPELAVYRELYKPKTEAPVTTGEEGTEGPPIPAMRVAGVIFGSTAGPTATMQIGERFIQVTPGKMIPEGNPVYRVERIEQDRVFLSRRWEMGTRKGVQRIEVTLAGSPGSSGGTGFAPGGGYPGMGGYPGVGGKGSPGGAPGLN